VGLLLLRTCRQWRLGTRAGGQAGGVSSGSLVASLYASGTVVYMLSSLFSSLSSSLWSGRVRPTGAGAVPYPAEVSGVVDAHQQLRDVTRATTVPVLARM
jgi:hypothetical protein